MHFSVTYLVPETVSDVVLLSIFHAHVYSFVGGGEKKGGGGRYVYVLLYGGCMLLFLLVEMVSFCLCLRPDVTVLVDWA